MMPQQSQQSPTDINHYQDMMLNLVYNVYQHRHHARRDGTEAAIRLAVFPASHSVSQLS